MARLEPGAKFGRYTILEVEKRKLGAYRVHVKCDCGTDKWVFASSLYAGTSKSCGCYNREVATTHGMSKHPLYSIWYHMIRRCYDKRFKAYKYYGGRGITVCDEWKNDFAIFARDMGDRPTLKHSIDRIDNDGNYCKENCRWATSKEQARNYSRNRWHSVGDRMMLMVQAAEEFNICWMHLQYLIDTKKMTLEEALKQPSPRPYTPRPPRTKKKEKSE